MLSNLIEKNRDEEGNILNEELISGYAASVYVGELFNIPCNGILSDHESVAGADTVR